MPLAILIILALFTTFALAKQPRSQAARNAFVKANPCPATSH